MPVCKIEKSLNTRENTASAPCLYSNVSSDLADLHVQVYEEFVHVQRRRRHRERVLISFFDKALQNVR